MYSCVQTTSPSGSTNVLVLDRRRPSRYLVSRPFSRKSKDRLRAGNPTLSGRQVPLRPKAERAGAVEVGETGVAECVARSFECPQAATTSSVTTPVRNLGN